MNCLEFELPILTETLAALDENTDSNGEYN